MGRLEIHPRRGHAARINPVHPEAVRLLDAERTAILDLHFHEKSVAEQRSSIRKQERETRRGWGCIGHNSWLGQPLSRASISASSPLARRGQLVSRGPRRRLRKGIYVDAIGISGRVNVRGLARERRFAFGTPLEEIET